MTLKNTLIFSFVFLLLGLISCNSEQGKTLDNAYTEQLAQDSVEREEIKTTALSFHKWYMAATDDPHNSSSSAHIVKGENGKCQFDFYDYFDAIRKLGTVSEKFLLSEKERVRDCEEYMKTVNYADYISSDAYVYQDECPHFYYMYWIRSQEPYSGIEVEELSKKGDNWQAKLIFYNDYEKKEYYDYYQPIVTLAKEGKSWKIISIN